MMTDFFVLQEMFHNGNSIVCVHYTNIAIICNLYNNIINFVALKHQQQ